MSFKDNKKIVKKGQVLHWILKFDGREDLEIPVEIEIEIGQLLDGTLGLTLGPKSNLPIEGEVTGLIRPHQLHHAKLYWVKNDSMTLEYGETFYLFNVEEITPDSATLYFHAYLPAEFGGGVIIYDSRQYLESTSPNDVV